MLGMSLAEVFGNQNLDGLIEQFFSGIAEHSFRLRVDQHYPPGAIHNDHGVGRCFQQTAEFLIPVAHTFIVVGSWLPARNWALQQSNYHSARHALSRDIGQEQTVRTASPSGKFPGRGRITTPRPR